MENKIFNIDENKVKGKKVHPQIIITAQKLIRKKLPPSFIEWLNKFGEETVINLGEGNFMTDKIFPQKKKEEIISMIYGARELIKQGWAINKDFIIFGGDGGENLFAFYTKFSKGGEFPIVLIAPDSEKPFILMAMNFSNFVNTYVNLEILRNSINDEKKLLKMAEKLLNKYEPNFDKNFVKQLVTWNWEFSDLKEINVRIKKMLK